MCTLERDGDVYVLRLTGADDEHRLNPTLCADIVSKLDIVDASDAKALVTTNDGKFFSNGLDLAWAAKDPDARSSVQSDAFVNLIQRFMRVRVPTIAAVCGHAAAGGFILAMAHDHRHMRGDRGFLYMSEMDVHIVIPPPIMSVLRYKMEPRAFKEVVLKALKLNGTTALELGLVDSVHQTPSETFEAAMTEAFHFAGRNWKKDVYLGIRRSMYPNLLASQDPHLPSSKL